MTATLAAVVRRVESSDGAAVMRFEPACYQAVVAGKAEGVYARNVTGILDSIVHANLCSAATAQMIFATSWGEYQFMGFLLYSSELDWNWPLVDFLADQNKQDTVFARWCARNGFDARNPLPADLERFARLYNGPGNVDGYVAALKKAAAAIEAAEQPKPVPAPIPARDVPLPPPPQPANPSPSGRKWWQIW